MLKPVILVVRDKTEWPSDEFVTQFAEEGYDTKDVDVSLISAALDETMPFGVIACSNAVDAFLEHTMSSRLENYICLVIYDPPATSKAMKSESFLCTPWPTVVHFPSTQASDSNFISPYIRSHVYMGQQPGFANPSSTNYNKTTAQMAYTRTLKLFRDKLGPKIDLEKIWEEHCMYEFVARDAKKTMATMVAQPYVNHIPTITGGIGYEELSRFYKYHFIHTNPPDMELISVSRTVGTDRLVDEMVVKFTHTTVIDWLLPGIPPTGKKVEIPMIGIINFRGAKLCREHLYWDQASVLVQIGLLEKGRLPICGVEAAIKVLDETSVPSNQLMPNWEESEGKPI